MASRKKSSGPRPTLGHTALGLVCGGLALAFVVLRTGRQSTVQTWLPLSPLLVGIGLVTGAFARHTLAGKVAVGLATLTLLLGCAAFALLLLMVGGWSNVH